MRALFDFGSDISLADRIRRGDRDAEASLVERYSRRVMAVASALVPDEAEDTYQDIFGAILLRLRDHGIDDPSKLAHYIFRTARNVALKAYRSADRRSVIARRMEDSAPDVGDSEPIEQVAREEAVQHVRQVIGELRTRRDRDVLFRFYVLEVDKTQICQELGLTPMHFNRVLFRARRRFRDLVKAKRIAAPERHIHRAASEA